VGSSTGPAPSNDQSAAARPARTPGRFLPWLGAHPIVCLALLTPGLPEYLSTSSPVLALVTNPAFFFLQILINVGQYTAGALLIREAMIRWRKGWGTVLLLGLAYGITEEGLGDNTLFNSNHGADGVLGSFGRFVGVNWVWATGVLAFHAIYSIGLPILLLRLALPATRGRSLLGRRGIFLGFASLAASTAVETVIVYGTFHFWMGPQLLAGSAAAIAVLVALAYRVPSDLGAPPTDLPSGRPWQVGVVGFAFFPVAFFLEYGFTSTAVPPAAIIVVEVIVFALLLDGVRRRVGRTANESLLVNLAFGFVLWQALFGLLLTLGLPYTLPLVALAVAFFLRLRKAYPAPTGPLPGAGEPAIPAGARGPG
jgi:hypothetical protein